MFVLSLLRVANISLSNPVLNTAIFCKLYFTIKVMVAGTSLQPILVPNKASEYSSTKTIAVDNHRPCAIDYRHHVVYPL